MLTLPLLAALFALAQSPPPNQLQFQARLSNAAGTPLAGPVTVETRVYDVPAGGVALWSETQLTTALNGVVNLALGAVTALPANLFDGSTRYLALRVNADPEMAPRRAILSVPFARRAAAAAALDAGATIPVGLVTSVQIADGTIQASDLGILLSAAPAGSGAVTIRGTAAVASEYGLVAESNSATQGAGVIGRATNTSGFQGAGVQGYSATPSGAGVWGDGQTGVFGGSTAPGGYGVYGYAYNGTGPGRGVLGWSPSPDGIGTMGENFSTTGATSGVRGVAHSPAGFGVSGESNSATGFGGVGVFGSSNNGDGVLGQTSTAANGVHGIGGVGVSGEGTSIGVSGSTASATVSNSGVRGLATATSGSASGLYGESAAPTGTGVWGRAAATSGTPVGVFGSTNATAGNPTGVYGLVSASGGVGVKGLNNATTGSAFGVFAQTVSDNGTALWAKSAATSGNTWGIYAQNDTGWGGVGGVPRALFGWATNSGAVADALVGQASHPAGYALWALGNFTATGTKFFTQPDPTDPSREIRFASLEGNESGTYFRGTATVKSGRAVVRVPAEFRLASEKEGMTVQVTPVGQLAQVCVESKSLDRIVIRSDRDGEVDYFVNGVRRGFAKHEAFAANRSFIPTWRGVPFGTQYPEAYRRLLVESGILNADFTPNEETAKRLGWELRDPKSDPQSPWRETEEVR